MTTINQKLDDFFFGNRSLGATAKAGESSAGISFSYLFFSDVRKDVSDRDKYRFARELVEFADQAGFEAVCFPERHFYEFGSIYANNSIAAAYFAPLTKNVRLRSAAVTNTLHHPVEIVENWAMVDILSDGRVDLGVGSGWNKADFILSPETYEDRAKIRDQRIPVIQKLWRGDTVDFPGPGGEIFPTVVYPRPIQQEINIWYFSLSEQGFRHAGLHGYNVFGMLHGIDLHEFRKYVDVYRAARAEAGLDPHSGRVTLMMHAFVHPDQEWVQQVVREPFKAYIRSSIIPQMKARDKHFDNSQIDHILDYAYARYFKTGGIFGPLEECQKQIDLAIASGVNEIAFLQDFGIDYAAVRNAFGYLQQLVEFNLKREKVAYA
ncbi:MULTISPECIES: MupA/Atu3671 family FMN-dependent luciferase-like monooxygenase [Dickeya]|uniref:MupA/Atu3671 family FMN-dependent luciferase-like monooxygenase n=1 Tax=Dickeya TaxID=204037 RepID=UPI003169679C